MIGIALVAMSLVLGESVKTAFGGALRSSIHADVVVSADGISPFDPTTVFRLCCDMLGPRRFVLVAVDP